ncbi:aminotransferase [Skermanella stibiiresistens]|uniref:aminotransferase n=1 Tax=Skermanella stibiiresistens TaxID=913326 RepID=UPI0004B99C26|nr:aminotransferase [Skermanella stibiiresistens]
MTAPVVTPKVGNPLFRDMPTTVFEVMSQLALKHQAINLGQGFPDDRGPADVLRAAADALLDGYNQYPSMMGTPELRQAVAAHAKRFYDLDVDWSREVMVTSGATEALGACLLGLIEPGDEVVLFEPMYDSYLPIIRLAGGIPRIVTLKAPDWSFTREDLERVFSPRTKALVINNPLNPVGKVYDRAELEMIGEFLTRFDAYAVCDEVYEHLVFDGARHIPLMTLPGLRDRCLRVGSAGKTFSLTGWKIGYVTGAPDLLQPVAKAHQFMTFTTAPNLQAGVAYGLSKDTSYFTGLSASMQAKRDRLAAGLREAGLSVLHSGGSYFLIADISSVGFEGDDVAFCLKLTEAAGVTAIPVSAFFAGTPPRNYVRFCFCKGDGLLDEAIARLKRYF